MVKSSLAKVSQSLQQSRQLQKTPCVPYYWRKCLRLNLVQSKALILQ